jgi:hypothetical protein
MATTMLEKIRDKVRALITDFGCSDFEVLPYENSNIFHLTECHVVSITKVTLNGVELGTGEYSYDSDTNAITVTVTGLGSGDILQVYYTFNKYSDTELDEYVKSALVWISTKSYKETDYEIEDDDIFPTPDNRTMDLIALVASILVKPDWSSYRLPTVTVAYPRRMPKEDKIAKLITEFHRGLGVSDVINFEED